MWVQTSEGTGNAGLLGVKKAYEFTLDKIGQDLNAGNIWQEYINFLESPKPGSPSYEALFSGGPPGQEEAQRTALVRWVQRNAQCCH